MKFFTQITGSRFTIEQMFYRYIHTAAGLAALMLLVVLAGCSTIAPRRPLGNLGDSVNSSADEFAPALRPGRNALYFTSNRSALEDIWRAPVNDPAGVTPAFAGAQPDATDISLLSQPTTNDGAAIFVAPGDGFFASGHAPDSMFAKGEGGFGGIVGGTDLFAFTAGNGKTAVYNLGPVINSVFWDSHPAAASRGDSLLLVFASDRPSGRYGFGSPYQGAVRVTGSGDVMRGNADLYYVFRIGDQWGPVRNFSDVIGDNTVNSSGNDYSPYLYCIDHAPRLLFSSNRAGSFDVWEGELAVDFAKQNITVGDVTKLPAGPDAINTGADEMFPFMTPPVDGDQGQYLYAASNRDQEGRTVNGEKVQSAGGFDLYRFPFSRECRAPRLVYEVIVLDAEDPSRPVPASVMRLHRAVRGSNVGKEPESVPVAEARGNPATFDVEIGSDYVLYGGSLRNEIDCNGPERAIESYSFLNVSPAQPEVSRKISWQWRDTVERATRIVVIDTVLRRDTIPLGNVSSIASTPASVITAVNIEGGHAIVTRLELGRREEILGGRPRKYKAQVIQYDTLWQYDSLWIPTTQMLAPSERVKRHGTLALPPVQANLTIRDTVWVYPKYYQAPSCEWLYTRSILDEYRKNVPYFQTAFWEVNTSENLRRDLQRLESPQFSDAGFVELHEDNLYFGDGTGNRRGRIADYTEFARTVDRNLDQMASELAEQIIPEFMEYDAKASASNNRLVVQVLAYSDVRPIVRGQYMGDETVRYVGGGYDSVGQNIVVQSVEILPGASLVSENNDTLSKVRVYYGYRELMKRLEKYPQFKKLVDDGVLLLPVGLTASEYRNRMERAKIIVTMEGRYADRTEQPTVSGYKGHGKDFYSLDDVRRMDLKVNRLEYINGKLMKSPCCSDGAKLSEK